jgi:hypothetical protein
MAGFQPHALFHSMNLDRSRDALDGGISDMADFDSRDKRFGWSSLKTDDAPGLNQSRASSRKQAFRGLLLFLKRANVRKVRWTYKGDWCATLRSAGEAPALQRLSVPEDRAAVVGQRSACRSNC